MNALSETENTSQHYVLPSSTNLSFRILEAAMLVTGFGVAQCKRYLAQSVVTLGCVNVYRDNKYIDIFNIGGGGSRLCLEYV